MATKPTLKDYFDKLFTSHQIYMIQTDTDDQERMKKQFQKVGLNIDDEITIVPVDTTEDISDKYDAMIYDYKPLEGNRLEESVYLAHTHSKVWEMFLESDKEYCIIFMDGITIKKLDTINEALEDLVEREYPILYLNYEVKLTEIPEDRNGIYNFGGALVTSTKAYIIHKDTVETLSTRVNPLREPTSYFISNLFRDKPHYGLTKQIVHPYKKKLTDDTPPSVNTGQQKIELPQNTTQEDITETSAINTSSQEESSIPSIVIDDITFTLLGKLGKEEEDKFEGRKFVKIEIIEKNGEKNIFLVYNSNSEGVWRFAEYVKAINKFDKGDLDYVTSTYIHIDLQILINKFFDKLPVLSETVNEIANKRVNKDLGRIINERDDKQTKISIPALNFFRICETGYCFIQKQEKLIDLLLFMGINLYSTKIKEYINSFTESLDVSYDGYIQRFHTIVREYYKTNYPGRNINDKFTQDNTSMIYDILINSTNIYLSSIIQIVDKKPEFIYAKINNVFNCSINSRYYRVKVIIDNKPFDMIINKHTIRGLPSYEGKTYCTIDNIIDSTATVLSGGTYNKIVSVGFFIYKPLEYTSQFNRSNKGIEIDNETCHGKTSYYYIGDLLSQLYPVNILCERLL